MARRRKSKEYQEFEKLLDKYADDIRRAWVTSIEDITGNVQLMRLQNAIERLRTVVGSSVTNATTAAEWAIERARIRAALAIETAAINAQLAALGLRYEAFRSVEEAIRQAFIAGGDHGTANLPKIASGDGARVVFRFNIRDPQAEAWLNTHSSGLITRIVEEQREVIRNTLIDGMARGQNPRRTALDIVGRVNRATGKRQGGAIGLSGPQEETMRWVKDAFAENDTAAMRRYLGLKRRDKRFDAMVRRAIDGERLSVESVERITGRLSDSYLKLRGETIARTESLTALNAGRTESFRQAAAQAGVEPGNITRVWSATMDGRTRETHSAMNGQVVRGLYLPFTTPRGARMMFPGDTSMGAPASETISCRCMASMRVDYFEGRA